MLVRTQSGPCAWVKSDERAQFSGLRNQITGIAGCCARAASGRSWMVDNLVGAFGAFPLALVVRSVPGRALLLGGKLGFELLDPRLQCGNHLAPIIRESWRLAM